MSVAGRGARLGALLGALALGCSSAPTSPEEQVAATLEQLEQAAREGDLKTLKDFVSARYRDEGGRTQQELHGLIAFHVLRRQSVYLLTRIRELALPTPTAADVSVVAAMAATPIRGVDSLRDVRADVYRFELRLALEEDRWRAVSGSWRPAKLDELL